jgi:16S rRNA (cytosine1402-N4)-methyltransferase
MKKGKKSTPVIELKTLTKSYGLGDAQNNAQDKLESLFRTLAEERFARQIAEALVLERKISPITTSGRLSSIVVGVYRKILHSTKEIPWVGGIHPATKVFQALRIEVNQELQVIKKVLPQALALLKPGGRLAVITFHSLEDRLVKHFFSAVNGKEGVVVTKKPRIADDAEVEHNPASRSAKLRVFEKK